MQKQFVKNKVHAMIQNPVEPDLAALTFNMLTEACKVWVFCRRCWKEVISWFEARNRNSDTIDIRTVKTLTQLVINMNIAELNWLLSRNTITKANATSDTCISLSTQTPTGWDYREKLRMYESDTSHHVHTLSSFFSLLQIRF